MNRPHLSCAIGIGSNVGDRCAHVEAAFEALARMPETRLAARGPVIETEAVGRDGVDPGGPYLNSAAMVETGLEPLALLAELHAIERGRGRDREHAPPWSARTLDLDLLVYGDRIMRTPTLIVPHPRLAERRFVLEPLAAIAPEMRIPGLERTVLQLLAALREHPHV